MKKILIVNTVGLSHDGITSIILSYLKEMNLDGLDIYIAGTIKIDNFVRKQLADIGCTIVEFPNRKTETLKYALNLIKFIRKEHIDVVHAHGNSTTLAIEMFSAWLGGCKKRIAHSHNTTCQQMRLNKILRPIFNIFYTDALACGKDAGKWLFGNKPFFILTNGRNIDSYSFNKNKRTEIREMLGITDELAIGHVGGFVEQKNHKFVIKIFREIKKSVSNSKLILIGDGPLKREIESEANDLDAIFTGAIENVADYLCAMDGVIFPSFFEGLPLAAIEWQINGLPCLISDTITEECILTDQVERISLDEKADIWSSKIIEMVRKNDRAKSSVTAMKTLKESEYNIKKGAHKLRIIYFSKKFSDYCRMEK